MFKALVLSIIVAALLLHPSTPGTFHLLPGYSEGGWRGGGSVTFDPYLIVIPPEYIYDKDGDV